MWLEPLREIMKLIFHEVNLAHVVYSGYVNKKTIIVVLEQSDFQKLPKSGPHNQSMLPLLKVPPGTAVCW